MVKKFLRFYGTRIFITAVKILELKPRSCVLFYLLLILCEKLSSDQSRYPSYNSVCIYKFSNIFTPLVLPGQDSDSLQLGRSGDQIPLGTRFSAPVQTGPAGHPASYTMGVSRG